MHMAVLKYKVLETREIWEAPTPKEEKRHALEANIRYFKAQSKMNKIRQEKVTKDTKTRKLGKHPVSYTHLTLPTIA